MPVTAEKPSSELYLSVAGALFLPLGPGALWWGQERTLVVSDLHLEKGSSYAQRGQFLPPYDTSATLNIVESLVDMLSPRRVISLGDSFHDRQSEERLDPSDRERIRYLTRQTDWIWVEGNHDPDPPAHLGGTGHKTLRMGSCVFRHEPTGEAGEISGHLHPVAKISGRGRTLRRKCFVTDGSRLIMPSLGTFTGGLNILDEAVEMHFREGRMVFAVSDERVHFVDRGMLIPDRSTGRMSAAWRL